MKIYLKGQLLDLKQLGMKKESNLNAHAHDAKRVLSFATLRKYRAPSDPSRSLIISPVPQPMSSTA